MDVPALPPSNKHPANGTPAHTPGRFRSPRYLVLRRHQGRLDTADRFIDSITDRFFLLASHPNIGRARDKDLRPGLRSFPVGEYVIIYRVEDDDVLILRVLRGSRDIAALFGH